MFRVEEPEAREDPGSSSAEVFMNGFLDLQSEILSCKRRVVDLFGPVDSDYVHDG